MGTPGRFRSTLLPLSKMKKGYLLPMASELPNPFPIQQCNYYLRVDDIMLKKFPFPSLSSDDSVIVSVNSVSPLYCFRYRNFSISSKTKFEKVL